MADLNTQIYTSETITLTRETSSVTSNNFKVANSNAVVIKVNDIVIQESEYELFVEDMLPGKVTVTFNRNYARGTRVEFTIKSVIKLYNEVGNNFDGATTDRQVYSATQVLDKKISELRSSDREYTDQRDDDLAKILRAEDAANSAADRAYADTQDDVHSQDDRGYTDNTKKELDIKIDALDTKLSDEIDNIPAGAQGRYRIYLYSQVLNGLVPNTPSQVTYDGTDFTGIPQGWQSEPFTTTDQDTYDYYQTFADYDPARNILGDWAGAFRISGDTGLPGKTGEPGRDGKPGEPGKQGEIGPQPTLALGTGVAEISSHVLYQHPSLPLDSVIPSYNFTRTLQAITDTTDTFHSEYTSPTFIAGFTAGADYTVRDIRHDGATRRCIVLTLQERLDTYSNIYFYTSNSTVDIPLPNIFGAKELAQYTEEDQSYIIENLSLHSGGNYNGFVVFSNGDKEVYMYQVGSGTEYLGWVNLDRIAAQKGDPGEDATDKHFVRVIRKEGIVVGDKDFYVENVSEIVQVDEYYLVNPVVSMLGTIADAEAGKFAIKDEDGIITYTSPNNGDGVKVYADRQVDITDSDGNVNFANENKIVALLIYEGGNWIITNSYFKTGNNNTETGAFANAEGDSNTVSGNFSHAEGSDNNVSGHAAHAEGVRNIVSGNISHAEGSSNVISGFAGHAEGEGHIITGNYGHAQGQRNRINGPREAHVEGFGNTIKTDYAHLQGRLAVLGHPDTLFGIGYSETFPSEEELAANDDANLVYKVDKFGNSTQTGKVVATEFEKADGTPVGEEVDLSDYYTKAESDAKDAAVLQGAEDNTYPKATIDSKDADTLAAAKVYTDENAVGKFADSVEVDDGKIVLGYSDDSTPIGSRQFIPNPGNSIGARDLVSVVRGSNNKVNLTASTSTDVTGLINALSPSAAANVKIHGQALRDGTVSEAKLDAAVQTKLNAAANVDLSDYYTKAEADAEDAKHSVQDNADTDRKLARYNGEYGSGLEFDITQVPNAGTPPTYTKPDILIEKNKNQVYVRYTDLHNLYLYLDTFAGQDIHLIEPGLSISSQVIKLTGFGIEMDFTADSTQGI